MSEIFMPKLGDAMTEGKVLRWYKKAGDPVKKGEPVVEIETDKVNLDLEAEEDGVLDRIQVEAGQTAEVGKTLAMTIPAGAALSKEEQIPPSAVSPQAVDKAKEAPVAPAVEKQEASREERKQSPIQEEVVPGDQRGAFVKPPSLVKQAEDKPQQPDVPGATLRSSPLARKMARDLGVELATLRGSGPAGRIIASDITRAAQTGAVRSGIEKKPGAGSGVPIAPMQELQDRTLPLSAMRRTIARRLVESLGPVPHFFLTIDLDVTHLILQRAQLNEIAAAKVSVNDFVTRATALALRHHPNVNASFTPEAIQEHAAIHVGIAVATPEGLITPVIRNADRKSVLEIATEVRSLVERAKNRKLKPDEYQGSTFTISNLGMFGIEEFTAIINPPNAAILAVGAASPKAVVIDGQIVIRDRMKVTMSCDHRVVDGVGGAEFLRTLRQYIEQPLRLML